MIEIKELRTESMLDEILKDLNLLIRADGTIGLAANGIAVSQETQTGAPPISLPSGDVGQIGGLIGGLPI